MRILIKVTFHFRRILIASYLCRVVQLVSCIGHSLRMDLDYSSLLAARSEIHALNLKCQPNEFELKS